MAVLKDAAVALACEYRKLCDCFCKDPLKTKAYRDVAALVPIPERPAVRYSTDHDRDNYGAMK